MKKTLLLPVLLVVFSQGFTAVSVYDDLEEDKDYADGFTHYSAYLDSSECPQECEPPPPCIRKPLPEFCDAINIPVRPILDECNAWNIWAIGEALLWQATEDNLYYGTFGTTEPQGLDPLRLDFKWDWGFRVGLGYNIPRDGWDIGLNWTHIKNHAHNNKKNGTDTVVKQTWGTPIHLLPIPTDFASGHWSVHLDQVDLKLGREFYVGRRLTLKPNVGARTAFIFQKFTSLFSGPSSVQGPSGTNEVTLKNQFWGFGFSAGVDSDWKLGGGFSLVGDAGFSLLFGYFKIHEKGVVTRQRAFRDVTGWHSNSSFRTEKPIFDLDLGVKWFHQFCRDRYRLTFKGLYEYHLYMNQNQWLQPTGDTDLFTLTPTSGDLGFQGISLSAQFDF